MELKERIVNEKLYGVFIKILDNTLITLLAKNSGMDFLFYDCEHGMYSYEKLHDLLLMGNSIGLLSFVRVAQLARGDISKVLDCGATGVMVPMIETVEQAKRLVDWSKYPPIGKRSYAGGANTNYSGSCNHKNNMMNINNRVITIAQIETKLGIDNIYEIAAVDGIDSILVGPADLAISLGIPEDYFNIKEIEAIDKVVDACKKNKKSFGIIGKLELVEKYKEDINLLVTKIDLDIIREGFIKSINEMKSLY